jgi:type VI secretion system protein ImpH
VRELVEQPGRFDFFQAVRLLERLARRNGEGREPVGTDADPGREAIRFAALPALSFPVGEIAAFHETPGGQAAHRPPAAAAGAGDGPPTTVPEMLVTFLGLTGPRGVLPDHYTTLLLSRLRHKDTVLRDFLDLFHHRLISHFHRAWEKYRFAFRWERGRLCGEDEVLFNHLLYALVGLGTGGLRGRLRVADPTFAFYAGQFSRRVRPAVELERMLGEHFDVPVAIEQFHGQWLRLGESDQSRLPGADCPQGQFNRLGENVVAGERVWTLDGKFRVRLGRLRLRQFWKFMPGRPALETLCQFVRAWVGPEFEFDVQAVLKVANVPRCDLVQHEPTGPRLGWNTWLVSRPTTQDVSDAVFRLNI